MPRIAPIPMHELSSHSREIVEAGVAAGLYATPVPLQIFAYRSAQLEQVNMARTHLGAGTLLGGRILELLRIRSAQLGECEPCSQSRKHDSITDEDVACLLAPRRRRADTAGADGRRIPRPTLRRSPLDRRRVLPPAGRAFHAPRRSSSSDSPAPGAMGLHRFIHTLDVYGDSMPVIDYSPDQVDSSR